MTKSAIDTFSEFASDYEASRRLMIEPFDLFYSTIIEALKFADRPIGRVLDLGAGTGLLSRFVRDRYPEAEIVLLDGSAEMLAQAAGTIGDPSTSVVQDLRDPLPDGEFDAIVSSMAIHHLPHPDQANLYARAFDALGAGGVFVNGEVVGGAGPKTVDAYQQWHHHSVLSRGGTSEDWDAYLGRQQADICAPLSSHLQWLDEAGFIEADCLFKQYMYGVLVGLKPS